MVYVAARKSNDSNSPDYNTPMSNQRWLWNGFAMRKVPDEPQADLTNICFHPANDIAHPVMMTAAQIASFFQV